MFRLGRKLAWIDGYPPAVLAVPPAVDPRVHLDARADIVGEQGRAPVRAPPAADQRDAAKQVGALHGGVRGEVLDLLAIDVERQGSHGTPYLSTLDGHLAVLDPRPAVAPAGDDQP